MTAPNTKVALITGTSRGLGRNTALKLAEQGVDVIATYNSGEAEAHDLIRKIEAMGHRAAAIQLDISDSRSFGRFAERIRAVLTSVWHRERFDFLVNNAGVGIYASISDTTEEQFDLLANVHLKGTFFLTQKLLPLIEDGGRIVNTSSGLARFSMPGYAAYAAMKGGVEVLTRYMAKELGARRIAVNSIAPGAIETDFGGGAVRDNRQLNTQLAEATAMGRVGLPDDVGGAVASLLTGENGWITGQRIEVSGGMAL